MKRWFQTGLLLLLALCLLPSSAVPGGAAIDAAAAQTGAEKRRYVGLGGDPFGVKLYTEGVLVIGIDAVETAAGPVTPGAAAGLRKGDVILSVNGAPVTETQGLIAAVAGSDCKPLALTVQRNGETLHLSLLPARTPVAASGDIGGVYVQTGLPPVDHAANTLLQTAAARTIFSGVP